MRPYTQHSLIILVVLFVVYLLLFDTLARPLFESQASELYGAEVTVSSVDMTVFQGKATLHDIEITDRSNPMRNLAQAKRAYIDIDLVKLLRDDIVDVESMDIQGLLMFGDRRRPGEILRPLVDADSDLARAGIPSFDRPDIDALIARQKGELDADLDRLRGAFDEAGSKWRERMNALPSDQAIEDYKAQLMGLELARQQTEDEATLAAMAASAREVQAEIRADLDNVQQTRLEFQQDIKRLRGQIERANRLPEIHTHALIRSIGLSPEQTAQLGNEMLRGELDGVLQQVLAPVVYSAEGQINPDTTPIKIEYATFSGPFLARAKSLVVNGELRKFRWPLEAASDASVLTLNGTGSAGGTLSIEATVDHRNGVDNRVNVDIRQLAMADVQLEGDEELELALGSATATINGQLLMSGDTLSGRFAQQYDDVTFSARTREGAGDAAELIVATLKGNDTFHIDVDFAGTPASPQLTFASDLDQQFRTTIENAVADDVAELTREIRDRVTSEARPRVAAAQERIAELMILEAALEGRLGSLDELSN